MKRKKTRKAQELKSKKISQNRILNSSVFLLFLTFIPLFFAGLFQGGYFPWEVYATLLLSLPVLFFLLHSTWVKNGKIKKSGADIAILIFLGVSFLSLFFTVYFHATLTEFYKVLLYVIIFYAGVNFTKTDYDFQIVLNGILLLGFILSVLGILAFIGVHFHINNGIFAFLVSKGFVQGNRVASSLQYANTFAAFLILPFFIAFSFAIHRKKIHAKIVYGVLALIFLIAFMLTESRGGIIVLVFVWILYLILLKGRDRKEGLAYTGLILVFGLALSFLEKSLFLPVIKNFGKRVSILINFLKGKKSASLGNRENMLKDSLKILKDHPVFGTGNGTYQYVYMKYRSVYFFSKFPHSIFFQVLDELGLVGGAAFLYMLYKMFEKGFSAIRKNFDVLSVGLFIGLLGIVLHAFIDFDWSLMFMPLLFFFGAGVLISRIDAGEFVFAKKKAETAQKRRQKKNSLAKNTIAISVITIFLFVLFIFPFAGASYDFRAGADQGRVPWQKTVSQYEAATNFDPVCAEYHYDLAHFYFSVLIPAASSNPQQFVSNAVKEYESAIKHCPEFFLYHFELARLYLQTGNKKAIDEFAKAVELNPIDPGGHAALGFAYLNLNNDTVMAKVQFDEALKLDPKNADAHLGMGSLYEKTGQTDKAIEEYKLAVKYNKKNAYAYYRLGILEEKNNLPQAIRDLFYAIKYNPNLTDAKKEFEKYGSIVSILKPSPGEIIKTGTSSALTWASSNPENVSYYDIWLIPEKGKGALIKSGIPGKTLSYKWNVPKTLSPGKYRIRIYAVNPKVMNNKKLGTWLYYAESGYFTINEK
jgi:tetratricopeptide (TPR) repeat protein